ncbi:MAG: PhoH-like ATPase [Alteromonas naphthalenivorans]|jgi:PhoH-like ATPase
MSATKSTSDQKSYPLHAPATDKKMYILDTNVLLHDPRAMFSFEGALVGIPIMVLEELEQFKKESSGRGKNAREIVRYLDMLRKDGSLSEGVKTEEGSIIRVLFTPDNVPVNASLSVDLVDNEILLTAVGYKNQGYEVRFISKDLNARVKADVLGLESEDYLKGYVRRDEFYKGWVRLKVPAVQLKQEVPEDLIQLAKERPMIVNEYVLVESNHNEHNYKVFRFVGGNKPFRPISAPQLQWSIDPRNAQQLMAMDALMDPSLELVSLLGPAGTGKTFLALLAGLDQVIVKETYQKMLVSRPVIPLGPDIGFLPGDLQEKLHSWMQPIYDNIDVIVHSASTGKHVQDVKDEAHHEEDYEQEHEGKKGHKKSKGKKSRNKFKIYSVDDLVHQGRLSLEAITYMRGRSIPYQFILIDEVQNLSPHEVKTLITRVGQGSKIVLCGDPYQIDSPYLDFSSNGLVIASDKFKDQSLFATVYLEHSERSELSHLAGKLL